MHESILSLILIRLYARFIEDLNHILHVGVLDTDLRIRIKI
jgi:hypothetical protein